MLSKEENGVNGIRFVSIEFWYFDNLTQAMPRVNAETHLAYSRIRKLF